MSGRVGNRLLFGDPQRDRMRRVATVWHRAPNCVVTTGAPSNGVLRLTPKFIPVAVRIDRLGVEVTSAGEAGSVVRLGVYADDGTMRPGALVVDGGTVDGTSATAQSVTVDVALERGWYWFGAATQLAPATQPTLRTIGTLLEPCPVDLQGVQPTSNNVFVLTCTATGALPATFTLLGSTNVAAAVSFRVA